MTDIQANKWEELKRKTEAMEKEIESNGAVELAENETIEEHKEEGQLDYPPHEELVKKLTEAEKLMSKYSDEVLRVKAEAENFRRRAERDVANAHKYALEKIAFELLPIIDNLERCLESNAYQQESELIKNVYVGVELILKMFLEVLQKFEIKQLNPLGEMFNPEQHTAISTREEPGLQANIVLQVVQRGYVLKDRLLRPAMVVVAKA